MTRRELVFMFIALVSAAVYVLFSTARGAIGFPLDDAWIHQVYARSIATHGEFAFFPGQPNAGSTSPLWALALSLGYLLGIDFHVWAYLLGAVLIGLGGIVLARLANRLSVIPGVAIYCLLFAVFEWHLAWSAVSGMEIPLFVFLSVVLVERFHARERVWVLGWVAGLLVLTRPEGLVLAALVAPGIIGDADRSGLARTVSQRWSGLSHALILYLLGFGILIAPYLAFNLTASGTIFPNTFYAKSAEYAILFESTPLILLWIRLLAVPWVGAQILLLPGFVYIIARLAANRDYRALIPLVWILALPAMYALRLPVAYQHGRYEMPLVPFIVLYGIWGTFELFSRIKVFLVRATWAISIAIVLIAFWILGANAYSTDVSFIDCEMVQTAHWVAANTPRDALIAAHDIGALGYYYDRPFIDLAGLVSPEIIPFIRDESRLRDYLFSRQTAFVIVFPDWYDSLTHDSRFTPIYQTGCAATRAAGGTNMTVYQLRTKP